MSLNRKKTDGNRADLPHIDKDQAAGFRPAFVPSRGNRSVQTENPYISQAPVLNSLEEHSRNNARYAARKKKTKRNVVIAVLAIFLIVIAGAGTAAAFYMGQINNQISNQDEEQAQAIDAVLKAPEVPDDPFYMMIIGSDSRYDEFGQRSDTNIVARIDPKTATVTLISIPRDTAINLDGYGMVKFNAAYNYYGTAGSIKAASDLLGVNISHYAEVDFSGLVDLVDAIGGVDVDVPMRIEDADAGGVVEAGQQHLDGEHALVFARSRAYTTADFQRTTNQRLLIEAFVKKALSISATELPGIVKTAAGSLTTDMSVSDILGYVMKFQSAEKTTVYSVLMPLTTANEDGVDYVICDKATLAKVMSVVNEGGDPSTVTSDFTVSSSSEAKEKGIEGIPVYTLTDDYNDDYNDSQYYYDNYSAGQSTYSAPVPDNGTNYTYSESAYTAPVYTEPQYADPNTGAAGTGGTTDSGGGGQPATGDATASTTYQ